MCGFITVINPVHKAIDVGKCRQSAMSLFHRGPDAGGEWISSAGDVYLGFRRLSIIDLSEAANQPMIGKTGKILTFNGEIYNFRSLRSELKSLGCHFRTQGDTEVLLEALQTWELEALKKVEGMFAFVLWDDRNKRATIVRDFFGIKPLYVWKNPRGGVAVASEIKAFYALPDFTARLNVNALPEYLRFRCLCDEQTLLKDVYQVQPGEYYRYDQETDHLTRSLYWGPAAGLMAAQSYGNGDQSVDGFLDRFRATVERHLIADVNVGTQFSGGIDSSLTSAISAKDLHARLIGFHCHVPHGFVDEKPYASAIAEHLHMDVQYTSLDADTFLSDLIERLTWHMDEPIGHPNALGVYLVSKLAHGQVKVLLSGEGADETFAGYYRYRRMIATDWLRHRPLAMNSAVRLAGILPGRVRKLVDTACTSSDHQILSDMQFVHDEFLTRLFADPDCVERSLLRRRNILSRYQALPVNGLARSQLFDIQTYLPSLLVRQDKMSMAASIENRVPFLTPEICSFALALPGSMRSNGFSTKILLKKALAHYLPKKLVYRTKVGFQLPLGEWFAGNAGRARLSEMVMPNSKLFDVVDKNETLRLIQGFNGAHDAADLAWILLTLKTWMDLFLGDKGSVIRSSGDRQAHLNS